MKRKKPTSKQWKRQIAVLSDSVSCSFGKKQHWSSHPGSYFCLLSFTFCLFTLFTACNEPFNPIQQNDQYPFSIHGYLDASQDTNWVRITAVRDSLFLNSPESIDAVVTLEHLESGNTDTMTDSLFRYEGGNYAHNYLTDMKLEPEQAYRLTVRRSDGAESHVEVTLPPEFPQPFILSTSGFYGYHLYIHNVQHLADVLVTYDLILHLHDLDGTHREDVPRVATFRHLADTLGGATFTMKRVEINTRPHLEFIGGLVDARRGDSITFVKREVKVSSAGPDWLNFSNLDENFISLPEGTSNVQGGTGYLIGVVSNTIEWPVE